MKITVIKESDRAKMLPKYFGPQMMKFESYVFYFAGELIPEYDGGYWEMYEVENGAFFMAPKIYRDLTELVPMQSPNGYSCMVDYVSAGIIVCIFALAQLSTDMYFADQNNGYIVDLCDKLKYLADECRYGREIFAMID